MYSGVGVEARELTWLYHASLKDKELDRDVTETLTHLQTATDLHMEALADKYVRSSLKMSYEELLSIGDKLPRDAYESALFEIQRLKLGFTLVIGGFIKDSPELFVVEPDGKVRLGDYWEAIGSGASCAHAMLHYREQSPKMNLPRTIYNVFEAKTFSETAGGVGAETEIYVLAKSRSYYFGNDEAFNSLKAQFRKFGPQEVVDPQYPVKTSQFFSFPNEP